MTTIPENSSWPGRDPSDDPDAVREQRIYTAFWLFYLYFRPKLFYSNFSKFVTRYSAIYAALVVGITEACGWISEKITAYEFGGRLSLPEEVITSWRTYWLLCLVGGVIGAVFYYRVGGWWYRVRLEWAGDPAPDALLARRAYIYAYLILAIPTLILTLIDTVRFPTPLAAERAVADGWMLVIVFLLWATYVSYRAVRVLFQCVRWKARLWFAVLPTVFYVALAGGMGIFLLGLGVLTNPKPDLRFTETLDHRHFSVEYPGNWWTTEEEGEWEGESLVTIEPVQDAYVVVSITPDLDDAEVALHGFVESYRETFGDAPATTFTTWGDFTGVGSQFTGEIEGAKYGIRVFSTSTPALTLTVIEVVETSVAPTVEPGLALIRRSLRLNPTE